MIRSCFCFKAKKSLAKSNEILVSTSKSNHREQEKKDVILKASSTFGVMEQESKLKKALEEERRISREAGKMVRFVTQESAKVDAYKG